VFVYSHLKNWLRESLTDFFFGEELITCSLLVLLNAASDLGDGFVELGFVGDDFVGDDFVGDDFVGDDFVVSIHSILFLDDATKEPCLLNLAPTVELVSGTVTWGLLVELYLREVIGLEVADSDALLCRVTIGEGGGDLASISSKVELMLPGDDQLPDNLLL